MNPELSAEAKPPISNKSLILASFLTAMGLFYGHNAVSDWGVTSNARLNIRSYEDGWARMQDEFLSRIQFDQKPQFLSIKAIPLNSTQGFFDALALIRASEQLRDNPGIKSRVAIELASTQEPIVEASAITEMVNKAFEDRKTFIEGKDPTLLTTKQQSFSRAIRRSLLSIALPLSALSLILTDIKRRRIQKACTTS